MPRIIAHLDMDAFFAAIEERDNPRFAGKPIVVGADPMEGGGRGVVSTANYKAREYGIHSAMPISTAWKLSQSAVKKGRPMTIFLPVDMDKYARVSGSVMQIVSHVVDVFEKTSIDEAYLDLSFTKSFSKAENLAKKIKGEIKRKEKLTASVGIGPNKLIAKLASAREKPDGLTIVRQEGVIRFLDLLSIRQLPGIGPKTQEKLNSYKIFTVSDLRKAGKRDLYSWFGKCGVEMYRKARGEDDSPIVTGQKIKSISEQETFKKDTLSASFLITRLIEMAKRVIDRMMAEKVEAYRTITITVRFFDFETKSRTRTLDVSVDNLAVLQKESLKLFLPFLDRRSNPKLKPIRLIGVGIENLKREEDIANISKTQDKPRQTKLFS